MKIAEKGEIVKEGEGEEYLEIFLDSASRRYYIERG